jgi:DNA-binding MarR family transcriptional regulator
MSQQLLAPETETEVEAETTVDLPTDLNSPASKLVYLYLKTSGECTVSDLQAALDMRKISLYPLLKSLSKRGLVDCNGERYSLA